MDEPTFFYARNDEMEMYGVCHAERMPTESEAVAGVGALSLPAGGEWRAWYDEGDARFRPAFIRAYVAELKPRPPTVEQLKMEV